MAFALLCTEWVATRSGEAVLALGVFVAAFVVVVPALYRETSRGGLWMAAYIVVCAGLVATVCFAAPLAGGYESYVAHPPAAVAIGVLVGIAGWVLGRDITLADGLAAETSRADVLGVQAEDARLVALRQQLDPHFLFNTLGAIAEWCRQDPLVAERALIELAAMLRTLFDGVRGRWWPLTRELDLLRALQHLYAVRDEERYEVRFAIEEGLDLAVPPLIFLPIFENALTHGNGDAPATFQVRRAGDRIELSLWNAGEYEGPREGGTGVDTTRRRLELAYGGAASLSVSSEIVDGTPGTRALMRIPARRDMSTLRTLIADDEKMARARLRRLLTSLGADVVAEAKNGEEALRALDEHEVDVAFFDINMPGLDGLSAGAIAQQRGVPVVFVTAHPQHAVQAFSQDAVHYLLKPVEAAGVSEALERLVAPPQQAPREGRLPLTRGRDVFLVDARKISHALYDGELVTVFAGEDSWIVDGSLQDLEGRIASQDFMRVHRRVLLNMARVTRLRSLDSGGFQALVDGHEVDVSRQAARALRKRLGI